MTLSPMRAFYYRSSCRLSLEEISSGPSEADTLVGDPSIRNKESLIQFLSVVQSVLLFEEID